MKDFLEAYSDDGALIFGGYFSFRNTIMAGGGEANKNIYKDDFIHRTIEHLTGYFGIEPKFNRKKLTEILGKVWENKFWEKNMQPYDSGSIERQANQIHKALGEPQAGKGEDATLMIISIVDVELNEPESLLARGGKIPQRYKDMGFSYAGQKKKSTRPEKKWMVLAKKGDKFKVVHGGQKGMKDFSQHKDKERQRRFWNRMGGFDSDKTKDPFSPLYWHKKFGTWEDGGNIESDDFGSSKKAHLYIR